MNENKKVLINWKAHIITAIISIIIGTGIFLAFFLTKRSLYGAFNGVTYAAISLIGGGVLYWVAREGFFDFVSYGFKQLGTMMFSKKANELNNFSVYKEYKNELREKKAKCYITVILVGVLFLIATIIIAIIYK